MKCRSATEQGGVRRCGRVWRTYFRLRPVTIVMGFWCSTKAASASPLALRTYSWTCTSGMMNREMITSQLQYRRHEAAACFNLALVRYVGGHRREPKVKNILKTLYLLSNPEISSWTVTTH